MEKVSIEAVEVVNDPLGMHSVRKPVSRDLGTEDFAMNYFELEPGESFSGRCTPSNAIRVHDAVRLRKSRGRWEPVEKHGGKHQKRDGEIEQHRTPQTREFSTPE